APPSPTSTPRSTEPPPAPPAPDPRVGGAIRPLLPPPRGEPNPFPPLLPRLPGPHARLGEDRPPRGGEGASRDGRGGGLPRLPRRPAVLQGGEQPRDRRRHPLRDGGGRPRGREPDDRGPRLATPEPAPDPRLEVPRRGGRPRPPRPRVERDRGPAR